MDKETRNRIHRSTQAARSLLEDEYRELLEGTFDILLDGTIASNPGAHLSDAQRVVRQKLVAAIVHEKSAGVTSADAVEAYLREAAFTSLNRFVALKMLEARELVQECVSRGEESSGFKEFGALAPGFAALPDKGYRLYVESLFDEIGREVRVLFDRRDSASLLWPRRQALESLLDMLNAPELDPVWKDDETIGWVYQYFNGDDERKAMREASQAPRNSHELAVRNQFFTPRYVVEFLVDNTLGRTWFEMRQGNTRLEESCEYLVRHHDEVFLSHVTADPEPDEGAKSVAEILLDPTEDSLPSFEEDELGDGGRRIEQRLIDLAHVVNGYARAPLEEQEGIWAKREEMGRSGDLAAFSTQELLDVMFYIVRAHRHSSTGEPLEDDIKPLAREVRARALRAVQEDLPEEIRLRAPTLIPYRPPKDPRDLRVLDPACGSGHFLLYCFDLLLTIYEEAWELGDELWQNFEQRPETSLRDEYATIEELRTSLPELILRHNLHGIDIDPRCAQIAAFALWLRAQRAFQEDGLAREDRPVIKRTNIVIAESMPGEADLRQAFMATLEPRLGKLVKCVFDSMSLAGEAGYLLRIDELLAESIREIYGNIGGLFAETEKSEWEQAGRDLRSALESFVTDAAAEQAFAYRLFAGDAARGLGFIDVCGQRYDTVLMNPPFGLVPPRLFRYLQDCYPDTYVDVYSAFVNRAVELAPSGQVGAISSRSFISSKKLQRWRKGQLIETLALLADLGGGVMDSAFVESAAYVLSPAQRGGQTFLALDVRSEPDKSKALRLALSGKNLERSYVASRAAIRSIPGGKLLYFLTSQLTELLQKSKRLEPGIGTVRKGLTTFDDFRFLRLRWEIPEPGSGGWDYFAKGGDYSNFYTNVHLCINRTNNAEELAERNRAVNGQVAQSRQGSSYYYRPGCQYTGRSARGFSARAIPRGCVMSSNAPMVLSESDVSPLYLLGWLNSRLVRSLIEMQAMASDFVPGILKNLPWIDPPSDAVRAVEVATLKALSESLRWSSLDEVDPRFCAPSTTFSSIEEARERAKHLYSSVTSEISSSQALITETIDEVYGLDSQQLGREVLERKIIEEITLEPLTAIEFVARQLSYAFGAAFGRWDVRVLRENCKEILDPFDRLPSKAPGMLLDENCCLPTQPPADYPLDFPVDGILVDDQGATGDLVSAVNLALEHVFEDPAVGREVAQSISASRDRTLREWFAREFFELHIKLYSRSRRKAPIYWQLATPSASYSAWLYYHRFSPDTLFRLLNDHVAPKLQHEERRLTNLTQDAGPNPTASQRKEIDALETFVGELRGFRDDVACVAPLWNPNLDDGAILNFAPLWRLVPHHKAWQKECKKAWDKLCKGDYDWAHLAMHLWPERVVPKCAEDRSLAIAHGLEEVFWGEDDNGKWQPRVVASDDVARLVTERTSPAVKEALTDLMAAPSAAPATRRRSRRPRKQSARTGSMRRTRGAKPPKSPRSSRPRSTIDGDTLRAMREAIGNTTGGAAKSDVLAVVNLSSGEWSRAIQTLLDRGEVIRTGAKRGTRYHVPADSDG